MLQFSYMRHNYRTKEERKVKTVWEGRMGRGEEEDRRWETHTGEHRRDSLRERMWERFYLHPHTGDKISTVRKPVSDRQFHMCILMKQWCLETQCMHTVKIEPKLSGERKITNSNGRLCTHSGFSFGANVLKSSETEFIYLISTCVYRLRVWSTVSSLITLHLVE